MRFRLLALLPTLLLGALVLPVVAQGPSRPTPSRQRITDFTGEVIAPGTVKVDRQWAPPVAPYPVRVTERLINRMRITELTAAPAVPVPPGAVAPGVAPPGAAPQGPFPLGIGSRFRRPPTPVIPPASPPVGYARRERSEVPAPVTPAPAPAAKGDPPAKPAPAPAPAPISNDVPADKLAAPEEASLKITKYTCGQVRTDDKGRKWVQVYGQPTCDSPGDIPGWVMPHPSGVPYFYTSDGRLFRLQTKAEDRKK